jgi:hypothetical protein
VILSINDIQHKRHSLCAIMLWLYAECCDFLIVMLNAIMLNVVMLNVVALRILPNLLA